MSLPSSPSIAVVGGGLAGLAAAHRLRESRPDCRVTLFEAGHRLGGVLETVERDGFLIERSADNFITNLPWGLDLCRRIGLADELIPTNARHRRAFVVHRGKLEPVPEGFTLVAPGKLWPLVTTPILSWRGKARLACEPFISTRYDPSDESLASFARRRLGSEAYERLVEPLVGGIYTADPEKLSVAATLPQFVDMVREFGSLARGMWRKKNSDHDAATGARYGLFVAPRQGMSRLVNRLVERTFSTDSHDTGRPETGTASLRVNRRVTSITRIPDVGWTVRAEGSAEALNFDRVIVATPSGVAAELLRDVDTSLADDLSGIEYASSAVVCLGYQRASIGHALDGFGFVVPARERRPILAGSFSSVKFPGRAPEGYVLIRVFLGGALRPEICDVEDAALIRIAREELALLIGARGEPVLTEVVRWPRAMPQYHVGHLERVARIESQLARLPGLALCGNAYRGVGIPNVIHSGELAAETISR